MEIEICTLKSRHSNLILGWLAGWLDKTLLSGWYLDNNLLSWVEHLLRILISQLESTSTSIFLLKFNFGTIHILRKHFLLNPPTHNNFTNCFSNFFLIYVLKMSNCSLKFLSQLQCNVEQEIILFWRKTKFSGKLDT